MHSMFYLVVAKFIYLIIVGMVSFQTKTIVDLVQAKVAVS